ncbi:MAG TPA: hypothetical protein VH352_04390 [Pseudonocardiaceae bacterium]|nr:hypothetical protein [Pseudonocardiaceae bacterium]
MTYPPQPPGPGPGPYGPPPGQADPFGQQSFAQQQYEQQMPGGYVGSPGYGQPPKKRTGLVVGIVIAVVVLVGAGVGGYFLFFHKNTAGTANATPQQVVSGFAQSYTSLAHTLSIDDLAKVKTYLCAKDQDAVQAIFDHEKGTNGKDTSFSMRADRVTTTGDGGTFMLTISEAGNTSPPHKGTLVRQNAQWLVCNTLSTPN